MALPPAARAVVTGAGSGLGRALRIEIAPRRGRGVASHVNVEAARAAAAALGGEAHAVACDVPKLEDVEHLAAEVDRLLGGVDLVVNNAGVAVGGDVGAVPVADWRWIVDVNLWGPVYGCH